MKNGSSSILALSQDMALEDNIHYSIEKPTQFTWRLRIRSIQVTDEGTYQCFVLTNQNSRAEDNRVISVVCMSQLLIFEQSQNLYFIVALRFCCFLTDFVVIFCLLSADYNIPVDSAIFHIPWAKSASSSY